MSQIDFATLRRISPEFNDAWTGIERWLTAHPGTRIIETDRISGDLPEISAWDLTRALNKLVADGAVTFKFMIRSPDGHLLRQRYDNVSEIPKEMWDRFHQHLFEVRDHHILPVFLIDQEGAAA